MHCQAATNVMHDWNSCHTPQLSLLVRGCSRGLTTLGDVWEPPLTYAKVIMSAGKRQDNTVQERRGRPHEKGVRFFQDDEDDFGLEDVLQVLSATLHGM